MTFTRLLIPDLLLADVIAHAHTDAPIECCGLLAGRIENGVGTVTTRFAVENALRSPTEYETDARGMIAAFRHMREHKLELLAIYHSHPTSEPVPSNRDVERNTYGESAVHLIVGFAASESVLRAWWLTERGYREAEWDAVSL